jgi:D-sedoheptulose 7-phosphate isomerase
VNLPENGSGRPRGIESLYPFLFASQKDRDAVTEEVRRSTREQALEIVAIRDRLAVGLDTRLTECAQALALRFAKGGRLFAFGNGGSASDAQSVARVFLDPSAGQPLPAYALTNDTAVVTALSNDIGFEVVFARQIAAFAEQGDIAVGLSTSGNSENVIRALYEAARRGLLTVGFAGYTGGRMAEMDSINYLFVVPSLSVHRIQEAQTTLYHVLWELTQLALTESSQGHPVDQRRPQL